MTNEEMISKLQEKDEYRVLSKFKFKSVYNENTNNSPFKIGCILDVETTGLVVEEDEITNIAVIAFQYADDGTIFRIIGKCNEFQQPSKSLTRETILLNGLTDEKLAGKSINRQKVIDIVKGADIVIAHNAQFDRSFVDKFFPELAHKTWCCSQHQIPWVEMGMASARQNYIAAMKYGFYYDEHLAQSDCLALLDILSRKEDGKYLLKYLLETLNDDHYIIKCPSPPWGSKDCLKSKNFLWEPATKTWWRNAQGTAELEQMKDFLNANVYSNKHPNNSSVTRLERNELFKTTIS